MSAVSTGKLMTDLLRVDDAHANLDLRGGLLVARRYRSIESDPIDSDNAVGEVSVDTHQQKTLSHWEGARVRVQNSWGCERSLGESP
jgi:hypothetical protein